MALLSPRLDVALLLLCVGACDLADAEDLDRPSPTTVAGKADGGASDRDLLCAKLGAGAGCDLCETWGWYDDGECDAGLVQTGLCDGPDPDCTKSCAEDASQFGCPEPEPEPEPEPTGPVVLESYVRSGYCDGGPSSSESLIVIGTGFENTGTLPTNHQTGTRWDLTGHAGPQPHWNQLTSTFGCVTVAGGWPIGRDIRVIATDGTYSNYVTVQDRR